MSSDNNRRGVSLDDSFDENIDDDSINATQGMMLLSHAVSERSDQIMSIMGSEEKYESLMDIVKSFRECEDKIDSFVKLWDSSAEAHTAIKYLEDSPEFFAAFLQTRQTQAYGYGGSLLLKEYALKKFTSGQAPKDIRRML
jgi:hypothetical protein